MRHVNTHTEAIVYIYNCSHSINIFFDKTIRRIVITKHRDGDFTENTNECLSLYTKKTRIAAYEKI